jgi:hypothetical protein
MLAIAFLYFKSVVGWCSWLLVDELKIDTLYKPCAAATT